MEVNLYELKKTIKDHPEVISILDCSSEEYLELLDISPKCFIYIPDHKINWKMIDLITNLIITYPHEKLHEKKDCEKLLLNIPSSITGSSDFEKNLKKILKSDGRYLQVLFSHSKFKITEDLILIALKSNPLSINDIPENQVNKKMISMVLKNKPKILESRDFQKCFSHLITKDLWYYSVRQNYECFEFMPNEYKSVDICIELLTNSNIFNFYLQIPATAHLSSNDEALQFLQKQKVILETL